MSPVPVEVKIPEAVYAISASFFCGMFQESYKKLGGQEKLLQVYKFSVSKDLEPQIEQGLERCSVDPRPFMSSI